MGKVYENINEKVQSFIEKQKMFFVATAPLMEQGHINLSPKGLDSFRILDEKTVAYADLIGSGVETIAHLKENARIVLMFCSFEGAPNIVRLHGSGEVIEPSHTDFNEIQKQFPEYLGIRSYIRIHCHRISDSCGFGVPLYEYQGERTQMTGWADSKGKESLDEYQREKNATSLDGLPGVSISQNKN